MTVNVNLQGFNFILKPLSQRQLMRIFRRAVKLGLVKSPIPVNFMSDALVIDLFGKLTELRAKSLGIDEKQIVALGNTPLL